MKKIFQIFSKCKIIYIALFLTLIIINLAICFGSFKTHEVSEEHDWFIFGNFNGNIYWVNTTEWEYDSGTAWNGSRMVGSFDGWISWGEFSGEIDGVFWGDLESTIDDTPITVELYHDNATINGTIVDSEAIDHLNELNLTWYIEGGFQGDVNGQLTEVNWIPTASGIGLIFIVFCVGLFLTHSIKYKDIMTLYLIWAIVAASLFYSIGYWLNKFISLGPTYFCAPPINPFLFWISPLLFLVSIFVMVKIYHFIFDNPVKYEDPLILYLISIRPGAYFSGLFILINLVQQIYIPYDVYIVQFPEFNRFFPSALGSYVIDSINIILLWIFIILILPLIHILTANITIIKTRKSDLQVQKQKETSKELDRMFYPWLQKYKMWIFLFVAAFIIMFAAVTVAFPMSDFSISGVSSALFGVSLIMIYIISITFVSYYTMKVHVKNGLVTKKMLKQTVVDNALSLTRFTFIVILFIAVILFCIKYMLFISLTNFHTTAYMPGLVQDIISNSNESVYFLIYLLTILIAITWLFMILLPFLYLTGKRKMVLGLIRFFLSVIIYGLADVAFSILYPNGNVFSLEASIQFITPAALAVSVIGYVVDSKKDDLLIKRVESIIQCHICNEDIHASWKICPYCMNENPPQK